MLGKLPPLLMMGATLPAKLNNILMLHHIVVSVETLLFILSSTLFGKNALLFGVVINYNTNKSSF